MAEMRGVVAVDQNKSFNPTATTGFRRISGLIAFSGKQNAFAVRCRRARV